MKQILLITDGCSNVGVSPVMAAAQAFAEQVVVNVVGIVDRGEIGGYGEREIAEVAKAGGGMSRLVETRNLSRTIQMMTRQTVAQTIRQTVHQELKQIIGDESVESLPPAKRSQVVQVIDNLAETADLQVALLIDASASMKPKLPAVEEAIRDLTLSLQAREGRSLIAVFHFPGKGERREGADMDLDWTDDIAKVHHLFYKLSMKGSTPTGPALLQVLAHLGAPMGTADAPYGRLDHADGGGGMLSDYVY